MENSKTAIQNIAASGRFREAVVYERFKVKLFDWENAGVLDKWSLTRVVVHCIHGGSTFIVFMKQTLCYLLIKVHVIKS